MKPKIRAFLLAATAGTLLLSSRLQLRWRRRHRRPSGQGRADLLVLGARHRQGRRRSGTPPTPTSRSPSASRRRATRRSPRSSPPTRPATRRTWSRPSTRRCRPWSATAPRPTSPSTSATPRSKFAPGVWSTITLGTDAVYAIPQDSGPMMLYYRADLFKKLGLTVPKTWDEFGQAAKQVQQKDPKRYLTTFSAGDPGWFAGLAQQAGAQWWSASAATPGRCTSTTPATKKVADYWGGLVADGAVDSQPMYTPEWNKALNDGTLIAWPSAVWGPGVLSGNAPDTAGKWAMRRAAAVDRRRAQDRQLGRLVHRRGRQDASTTRRPPQFAVWLNTDPAAVTGAGHRGRHLPGRHRRAVRRRPGQAAGVLHQPARLLHPRPADRGHRGRRHVGPERQRHLRHLQGRLRQGRSPSKTAFGPRRRRDADGHGRRPEEERLQGLGTDDRRPARVRPARRRPSDAVPYAFLAPAIVLFAALHGRADRLHRLPEPAPGEGDRAGARRRRPHRDLRRPRQLPRPCWPTASSGAARCGC